MNELNTHLGVFSGFPPEHNAHVINSVNFIRAFEQMRFRGLVGFTSNEKRNKRERFNDNLAAYGVEGLISPLDYPTIPVINMSSYDYGHDLSEEIADEIRASRIDIMFMAYFPLFGRKFIEILRKMRKRILLTSKIGLVRAEESPFSKYHKGYEDALGEVDRVLVHQNNDRRIIVDRCGISEDKVAVATKFVDTVLLEQVSSQTGPTLQKFGLSDFFKRHSKVVGYVGRIDEEKNVDVLIEDIWPRVKIEQENAGLLVIGSGEYADSIKERFATEIDVKVVSKQLTSMEVLCILSVLDVLAFPSGADYTPRIPMEALLVGTEVVLNDQNFNEIFKPYAQAVPISAYETYSPHGYIDGTRSLNEVVANQKIYGKPNPDAFAEGILRALVEKKSMTFPKEEFTTQGFARVFHEILERM